MKKLVIAVLADAEQQKEWLKHSQRTDNQFVFADSLRSLQIIEADIYIDMNFEPQQERIEQLKKIRGIVIVNSVSYTTGYINEKFVRIAGWAGLVSRDKIELALPAGFPSESSKLLEACGLPLQIVPDIKGMVTPRILSMIINEAFFVLGEGVSSKKEIDVAMKTGTNYPLGPFEWANLIGIEKVFTLLKELSDSDDRYVIAPALEEEVLAVSE